MSSYADSYSTSADDAPRSTPAVRWIISACALLYFLQLTSPVGGLDMQQALGVRWDDLPGRWWKAVTYTFVHGSFWHLLANMYMLWLFGTRVEHALGRPGRFVQRYVAYGVAGLLLHALFIREGLLVGASGAVFGVMVAYAAMWPEERMLIFPLPFAVRVKWLVVAYVAYDVFRGSLGGGASSGVAYWAHVGGALAAFLEHYFRRRSPSEGLERIRQRINQVPDEPDETPRAVPRSMPRPRERGSEADEVVARSKALAAPRRPTPPPPPRGGLRPEDIDMVLDKISAQGIESLTPDERRLLEEMSKRLRDR